MDMEHGRFDITPPEGRRRDGGGICIIKEAKQVSPLTLPTSKPPQDDLLVEPTLGGEGWRLTSSEPLVRPYQAPTSFLDIIRSWGNTWLWEHLQVSGGESWIHESIADDSLVAVADGLYISGRYTQTCAPPRLSWNAPRGKGVSWGPFQKRYRWQTHTGGNFLAYWPYT
jgi:hypothetical protein